MSTTLYITLNPEVPGVLANAHDRDLMAGLMDELDQAATDLGVAPLSNFQSAESAVSGVEKTTSKGGGTGGTLVEFYEPGRAMATLNALAEHFRDHPMGPVNGRDRSMELVLEIEDCVRVLGEAGKRGARFRFHIGE